MIIIVKIFCHGLLKKDNKLLIMQRGNSKVYPYLWDLPGGYKEEKENYIDCVIREFKEETNLDIIVKDLVDVKGQLYDNDIIIVLIYKVISKSDTIKLNNEHVNYEYVDILDNKNMIWYIDNTMIVNTIK